MNARATKPGCSPRIRASGTFQGVAGVRPDGDLGCDRSGARSSVLKTALTPQPARNPNLNLSLWLASAGGHPYCHFRPAQGRVAMSLPGMRFRLSFVAVRDRWPGKRLCSSSWTVVALGLGALPPSTFGFRPSEFSVRRTSSGSASRNGARRRKRLMPRKPIAPRGLFMEGLLLI